MLDFYVHESLQRQGVGLRAESKEGVVSPWKVVLEAGPSQAGELPKVAQDHEELLGCLVPDQCAEGQELAEPSNQN